MKTILAAFGLYVVVLLTLGSLGIGNFRLYYGPDERGCTKMEARHER